MFERSTSDAVEPGRPGTALGWKTPLVVLLLYGVAIAIATYPRVARMGDSLPGFRVDPLNHICMMKWYKSCLVEGKSYVLNPNLQYPVGFPLALNSPMLLQAGLFLPISAISSNDYLCYNVIWFVGFLFSGLSVFVLAWTVLRDRFAAGFAGLVAMLCTPMMMRGHGHLELMFAGSTGLFLASWIAWVDRPRRGGLFLTASLYLLAALAAAYFAVMPIVPAAAYVAWRMVGVARAEGWRSGGRWLVSRVGWFSAFVGLVVPGMLAVFSSQFWAATRGISMERPISDFERYGTPLWTYVLPTAQHEAFAAYPVESYVSGNVPEVECASYLGILTLALIGYAAARRVRFTNAGYWWFTLGSLVVLSMGAYLVVGSQRIPLPALWLRQAIPMFKSLRAPCRFNLMVGVVAALIAAAGLRRLMAGLPKPWMRGLVGSLAVVLTVLDLGITPFLTDPNRPTMPDAYAWIKARNPNAALLEAPLLSSGCPHALTETCAYWQSSHGLKTTAGYSSFVNNEFDDLLVDDSPFFVATLSNPFAFDHPESMSVGVVSDVGLRDYAWLVARRARFDYIVLHGWDESMQIRSPSFAKLIYALEPAHVKSDFRVIVYDTNRLPTPTRPVLLCDKGLRSWRGRPGQAMRVMGRTGQVTAFAPDPREKLVFSMDAIAFRHPRAVTLRLGDEVLARWDVGTQATGTFESPPISLPDGLQTLTLTSDGEDAPNTPAEEACVWDTAPYALKILKLGLRSTAP